MADRIKGFTVVLERDVREDDVETIVNAIKMIKGVSDVQNHIVSGEDYFIESRTKNKIREELIQFIKEKF